ncbi:sensor histidine kinase [Paenibacillus daejeonensis]|uniref:sensor histidine kinase n=1 Tax=Paenibacillus daejeonensis TaxID=135193 RepID=UPI001B7F943C|nr:HAMP domain-containing sensor histidine kinase [Paenibacillus daejeonensis]
MYLFFIGAASLIWIIPVVSAQWIDRYLHPTEVNVWDHPTEWVEMLLADAGEWGSDEWEHHLNEHLAATEVQMLITAPDHLPLYQYNMEQKDDDASTTITEPMYKTTVYHEGSVAGYVYLSPSQPRVISSADTDTIMLRYVFVIIGLLLLAGLYCIRRHIVRPIQSLIQASSKVAAGDYHIQLGSSRIKELREVSDAYLHMSRSLAVLEKQREEHEADRSFLLSSIVHDLRTPLFSMKGYLEGIAHGIAKTEERKVQYLNRSLELARRLDHLISMLSKYNESHLIATQRKVEPVDLAELTDRVMQGLQFQFDQKHITTIQKYEIKQAVEADYELLYRAIENVFINAIRFSPEHGKIEVEITQQASGSIRLAIRDEGPGFSKDDLSKVFKPLYQADKSRGSEHPGIGLGLAISKTIIEHHGGTIRAYNNRHQGACLIIELK